MTATRRTFRIFVSSTFGDMKDERNALQKHIFPRLRELCTENGARFQAIDLRWGVSEQAGHDQRTMAICLSEVERCLKVTPRPNFIALLGDRYGWCPLPYEIPADEFEAIAAQATDEDDQELMQVWYRRDDNAVPPVYCLQPRKGDYRDFETWSAVEERLHAVLADAVEHLDLSPAQYAKYVTSATEQEIVAGIFDAPDPARRVFCFFRNGGDDDDPRLTNLKGRLRACVPNNIDDYDPGDMDALCDAIYVRLASTIEAELAEHRRWVDPLEAEIRAHREWGEARGRFFVGRADILSRIGDYLGQPAAQPLALFGESGVGKTTVMAEVARQAREMHPGAELVCRFVGATPSSTNVHMLLNSLCQQINRRYGAGVEIPTDYNELVQVFYELLTQATAERPLGVILDALDQLADTPNAHQLRWLPFGLPEHVHLIVSTLPGVSLEALEARLPEMNRVEVTPMPVEEGRELLAVWLDEVRRTLQPDQEDEVLGGFKQNGNPLWLRLAFEEARLWESYAGARPLGPDVLGIIRDSLFKRLADPANHGPMLVSCGLGYLAAAKNGLTEDELLDLLARDEPFWADLKARTHKAWRRLLDEFGRVPVVVWLRLYFDLRPYLTERAADGTSLLGFYHRQLSEAAAASYLVGDEKPLLHSTLADYFGGQELYVGKSELPNLRKLSELPHHFVGAERNDGLYTLLTGSPDWMEAKYAAALGDASYVADLELAMQQKPYILILTQLRAAQQIINARVSAYTDEDLEVLVWLGRKTEALIHARLRSEKQERYSGLVAVYEACKKEYRPDLALLEETLAVARGIESTESRAKALSAVASALAQAGDDRADGIFEEALNAATSANSVSDQARALIDVTVALAQAGRVDEALDIAKNIGRGWSMAAVWENVAVALTQNGRLEEALGVSMSAAPVSKPNVLSAVALTLTQANDGRADEVFEEALKAAREISMGKEQCRALRLVARALARTGRFEEAWGAAWGIESVSHRSIRADALSDVAAAMVQDGWIQEALAEASSIADAYTRYKVTETIAVALAQTGRAEEALETARSIRCPGINGIGSDARSAMAVALAQTGRVEEALRVVRNTPDDRKEAGVLSVVAVALAQAGDDRTDEVFKEALTLARTPRTFHEPVKVLKNMAKVLAQAGDDRAREVLSEALDVSRDSVYSWEREETLGAVLVALAHAGRVGKAVDFVRRTPDFRKRTDVLTAVVVAQVKSGRFAEALDVARGIDHGNPKNRADALRIVATAMAQANNKRSSEVFEEALVEARRSWSNSSKAPALGAIAVAMARAGDARSGSVFTEALDAARDIEYDVLRSRAPALSAVATAMTQAGDERAGEIFRETLNAASGFDHSYLNTETLSAMAEELAQAGWIEEMMDVARGIKSGERRVRVLSAVAKAMTQANDERAGEVLEKALKVARDIEYSGDRADALMVVASAMVQAGRFDEAQGIARSIKDDDALTVVASAMARAGKIDEALDVLGPRELPYFMRTLADWAESFEKVELGLSVAVLREAMRIISWVQPSWQPIYEILAQD